MTHSSSSSSSSSSDTHDHVSEERHVDSQGNEYITTTTYETVQEPMEPSPLPQRTAPYISSLKSSPNNSPHSSPSTQRRVVIANPYADKTPDNEQGMVVENVTVAKQLSAPSQVKPKKWTGPVKRKWSLGLEDLNLKLVKACIAEFLGTLMLILFCVGSANSRSLEALNTNAPLYYIAISIAFGLGIGGIVHIISDVSGGNVNPAVSLALFIDARMSLLKMLFYWVSQFLGGFVGAGLLWGLGNHGDINNSAYYGWTSYTDINGAQAFFLEAFGTMFLVLTILATINERRGHAPSFLQPLAIGFSILVLHIFLIPYTNCGINPVRGSVWNIVTGKGTDSKILVYLFGPLLGAAAAVPLYNFVLCPCGE